MDIKQLLSSCADDAKNEEDAMIIMRSVRHITMLESENAALELALAVMTDERDKYAAGMQENCSLLTENAALRKCNSELIESIKESVREVNDVLISEIERQKIRNTQLRQRVQELEEAQRWIPVTERLPEKEGAYQVTREHSITADIFVANDIYSPTFGEYFHPSVIAWRELPSPYEAPHA